MAKYKTEQKKRIIKVLSENSKEISIKDIENKIKNNGDKIGLVTIYRCLDELEKDNIVIKKNTDKGAVYIYSKLL